MNSSSEVVQELCITAPLEINKVFHNITVEEFKLIWFSKSRQQIIQKEAFPILVGWQWKEIESVLNLVHLQRLVFNSIFKGVVFGFSQSSERLSAWNLVFKSHLVDIDWSIKHISKHRVVFVLELEDRAIVRLRNVGIHGMNERPFRHFKSVAEDITVEEVSNFNSFFNQLNEV